MRQIDLLDPDIIKGNLKTKRIGRKILVYNSTSSTNDIAAEYAKDKSNDGMVIFAEEQTAGRGRAGNKWLSKQADSILCSIVLTNSRLDCELLSLTCAVAIADAVGKIGSGEAKIKWPNDILLAGKKVAGILLESKTKDNSNTYIIGIGINCHQKKDSFLPELQPIATSIDIEAGTICDRNLLAKRLLASLDSWLETAEKNSKDVLEQWCQLSIQLGHRIKLIYNGKKFTGHCIGIDPKMGLILQLDSGGVRMFPASHTTIAK
jgi:BirA family biotin operon repressor/biotin-[acetyl-CoA-carboxylase] ligase